jgi:hypothetical protein
MIPGWIAASKIETGITSYFSFVFNSLEQSCASIDELKKIIITYNKIKFIENNKYLDNNTFIYLTKYEETHQNIEKLKIIFKDDSLSNKIDIAKTSSLNSDINIVISTTPKAVLGNVLAKDLETFYAFDIRKSFNPLEMVMPKFFVLMFLLIISAFLTAFWTTIQAYFFHRKQSGFNERVFETNNSSKSAQLTFLNTRLDHIYEDLNHLFLSTNFEHKDPRPSLEKKMGDISQSLGRIITFGTLKRDYCKIELIQEINIVVDCFLEEISNKKISVIKKFLNPVYIQQTKSKHLLILFSVMHHFIINMPPKGQLTITVDIENEHSTKVIFSDNMPLSWKLFEHEKGVSKGLSPLFFTFDKLMYACADEEIVANQSNNTSGNYFTLEYKQNRDQNNLNVIQGNFR